MAYLVNDTTTVEAVVTKKGREKMASGRGLNITKFAVSDDEIDYTLYDSAHPLGSAYYDSAILALPITEPSPDETQVMRYKIVTLPKTTTRIPQISAGIPSISRAYNQGIVAISPSTTGGGNSRMGYTAILHNRRAGEVIASGLENVTVGSIPIFLGDATARTAQVANGLVFEFIPNSQITTDITTKITFVGNETGGTVVIPVTVTAPTSS
jgi:hypothetical protein